jgi:hypothetical protein
MEKGQIRVPELNQMANCRGCRLCLTIDVLSVQTNHNVQHPASLQLLDLILPQSASPQNQKRVHSSAEHVQVRRKLWAGRPMREMEQNQRVIAAAECPPGSFNSSAVGRLAERRSHNANASSPAGGQPCRGG